jgi:hypothetical protein
VDSSPLAFNDPAGLRNPWGKRGSPAHCKKVDDIEKYFTDPKRGCTLDSGGTRPEQKFGNRYPDLVFKDKSGNRFAIQVGRSTKGGKPVSRERAALCDLRKRPDFKHVFFFKYN